MNTTYTIHLQYLQTENTQVLGNKWEILRLLRVKKEKAHNT